MTRLLLLFVLLAGSANAIEPNKRRIDDHVRMFVETVPTRVARKIEKELDDAVIDRATKLGRQHSSPLLVSCRNSKRRYTVKVDIQGEILQKTEEDGAPGTAVRASKLPFEVRKTVRRECHAGDVQRAYRIKDSTGVVYELFVEEPKQIVEIKLTPRGKVVDKKVIEIEMNHNDEFEWHPPARR